MTKLTLHDLTEALRLTGIIYEDKGAWVNGFQEWVDLTEYLEESLMILNNNSVEST